MATIIKNTNECDVEHETLVIEEYGDEVLCAGWNPQLAQVGDSPVTQHNRHINLPADLANVDVDTFLKKMYEYQS
jgi:hypothetical protein